MLQLRWCGGHHTLALQRRRLAQRYVAAAQQAQGVIEMLSGIAPSALAIIAVAGAAWLAYRHFNRIEGIRLDDARTGANDRI